MRTRILAEARENVPRIVLLITDGGSDKTELTQHQAHLLKSEQDAIVFVLAISNKVRQRPIYGLGLQLGNTECTTSNHQLGNLSKAAVMCLGYYLDFGCFNPLEAATFSITSLQ